MTLAKISDRSVFAAPAAIACRNSTRNRSVGVPLQNGAILAPVSEQIVFSSEQTLLPQSRLSFVGAKVSDKSVFTAPQAIGCAVSANSRFVAVAEQNGAILAPIRWCVESGQQAMQIWN